MLCLLVCFKVPELIADARFYNRFVLPKGIYHLGMEKGSAILKRHLINTSSTISSSRLVDYCTVLF
jgi:hypothetical protein